MIERHRVYGVRVSGWQAQGKSIKSATKGIAPPLYRI